MAKEKILKVRSNTTDKTGSIKSFVYEFPYDGITKYKEAYQNAFGMFRKEAIEAAKMVSLGCDKKEVELLDDEKIIQVFKCEYFENKH